jgi:hypothetical protein
MAKRVINQNYVYKETKRTLNSRILTSSKNGKDEKYVHEMMEEYQLGKLGIESGIILKRALKKKF